MINFLRDYFQSNSYNEIKKNDDLQEILFDDFIKTYPNDIENIKVEEIDQCVRKIVKDLLKLSSTLADLSKIESHLNVLNQNRAFRVKLIQKLATTKNPELIRIMENLQKIVTPKYG